MTQSVKNVIYKALHLLFLPIRICYRKRNGTQTHATHKEIPNEILLGAVRDSIRQGYTATIMVKGWSMRPFLEHIRDKVQLNSPQNAQKYDAVLAEISPGKYVLHRIINIKHHPQDSNLDEITLMGDGNIRETEQCMRKDLCGVVTHYIRPNRIIPADKPQLTKSIILWNKLLPLRRYLLFIYRTII
jgi:hypothetical protein